LLARRGACVSAEDWAAPMIDAALRHEAAEPLGIGYSLADARTLGRRRKAASFDRVVACMSFDDMPDLPKVLRGVYRVLRPGGRLVFSVSHPLNSAARGWERPAASDRGGMIIDRYFDEGPGVTEWRMARLKRPFDTVFWHRTMESWFDLLVRSGFDVEHLSEPRPSPRDVERYPTLRGSGKVPFYLVIRARKRASGEPTISRSVRSAHAPKMEK
jgi:SAM-dependent methyltransferase